MIYLNKIHFNIGKFMNDNKPKIVFWKRWEEHFGEPRTGTLKYALLNRKKTGFYRCVRIINKRIYLDVKSTFEFFNSSKEILKKNNI